MKKLLILLFIIFVSSIVEAQELVRRNMQDGDGVIQEFYMENYTPEHEVYSKVNNKYHGSWMAVGSDSTVYISGQYDMGTRIGTWQLSYPDGKLRYITNYDSLGNVVDWTRYYNNQPVVRIDRAGGIEDHVFTTIISEEGKLFIKELHQGHTKMLNSNRTLYRAYLELDVPTRCLSLAWPAKEATVDYHVIRYRYPSGFVYSDYVVGNGKIKKKKVFFYKKELLKSIDYYEYGNLIKTETYDKEGKLAKVKEY